MEATTYSRYYSMAIVLILGMATSLAQAAPPNQTGAEDKVWPDISCHPVFDYSSRPGYLKLNKQRWVDCQREESKTGTCPKLCVMEWTGMMSRYKGEEKGANDPVIFKVSSMVNFLAKTNGYLDRKGGPEAEALLNKVEEEMEACAKTHKEFQNWKMHVPCAQWDGFLTCVENAFQCTK